MKWLILFLIFLAFIGFKIFNVYPDNIEKPFSIDQEKEIRKIKINNKEFDVIIAKTEAERQQGLSGKIEMPKNLGMLFLMPQKGIYPFWMKEMNFALDFIWIDGDRIVQIDENISLQNLPMPKSINTIIPVDKVLELNAGACKETNIKVGDNIEFLYD